MVLVLPPNVVLATEDELPIYNMTGIQGELALKSEVLGSWRDGTEVKSTGYSSDNWGKFPVPTRWLPLSITLVPGDLMPSGL